MIIRLNEIEARDVLRDGQVGRLGCISEGWPYIVPVNYEFVDDCIVSHSLPGAKITALRANPNACLQVDDVEIGYRWRSVLAFGRYEEILKPHERQQFLGRLLKRFPLLTPVESSLAEDGGPPPVIVFRIRVERITGVAEE
jgi:uncharacterized protein